jgi:hypothetical protein
MPKINEYLPEQDAQGPVGQTSPMLEQASMFGRGIESFGRDLTDATKVVIQRQTQEEAADASATVSEQRMLYANRINEATRDGSINDENGPNSLSKITSDYQDWTNKQFDSYSTAGGKDAFTRASARTGGMLLQHGAAQSAIAAGVKAGQDLNTQLNNDSNLVRQYPNMYADLHDGQTEAIQAQVTAGTLTPAVASQTQKAHDLEMAKATVRGYMDQDYNAIKAAVVSNGDKIDPNAPEFSTAKTMLDGHFNQDMSSDDKQKMYQELLANNRNAQFAGQQVLAQKQMAFDAQKESFKLQAYQKLQTNSLTPEEVQNSGLFDADEQQRFNHLIQASGKEAIMGDPAMKNELSERILLPPNDPRHISDPMQMAFMVKDHMISMRDFSDLSQMVQSNPANKANNVAELQDLQSARDKFGSSPDGQYRLMQYQQYVQSAKQGALNSGQPVSSLFDPSAKEYVGNKLNQFLPTPSQVLKQQADAIRTGQFAPANIDTRPGAVSPIMGSLPPKMETIEQTDNAASSDPLSGDSGFKKKTITRQMKLPTGMFENSNYDNISSLDKRDLQKMTQYDLTDAQKKAAAARWDELTKRGE